MWHGSSVCIMVISKDPWHLLQKRWVRVRNYQERFYFVVTLLTLLYFSSQHHLNAPLRLKKAFCGIIFSHFTVSVSIIYIEVMPPTKSRCLKVVLSLIVFLSLYNRPSLLAQCSINTHSKRWKQSYREFILRRWKSVSIIKHSLLMVFIICTKLIRKKNLSYNFTPQNMEYISLLGCLLIYRCR